ncbi:5-formyltetrahydrofolate cyclo-ligase [Nesterenkonia natronophila]|nr:5-formyltetrahydrofolate cyclo-ligase [Nesterenkonia natronophila]
MSVHTKPEVRRRVRAARAALSAAELADRGEAMAESLERHIHPATVVAGYVPMQGEPNVLPFLKRHTLRSGPVYLPVIPPTGHILGWAPWHPQSPMRRHPKLPIYEPAHGSPLPSGVLVDHASTSQCPTSLVLLVPTLALDTAGARLGQGGGYYDATTAKLFEILQEHPKVSCELIAVVHFGELMEPGSFPVESHDLRAARAVTEYGVIDL